MKPFPSCLDCLEPRGLELVVHTRHMRVSEPALGLFVEGDKISDIVNISAILLKRLELVLKTLLQPFRLRGAKQQVRGTVSNR